MHGASQLAPVIILNEGSYLILTVLKTLPELVVIFLLHLGNHFAAVLQLISLLQTGHEY